MMFRNILNTFGTRLITLALSFFLLILTTRYLGAYGRGMISLVVTSVGILVLLNGFVGGAALVYVIPKHKSKSFLRKILGFSFFWGFVVALVGAFVISYLGFVPKNLVIHIFALGAFASVFSALTMAFLGYEKISKYNAASLIQVFLNFFVFGSAIIAVKKVTVNSFLFSLYASYVIGIFFALFFLAKIYKNLKEESNSPISFKHHAKEISKYGFVSQLGNVIQYLNYRLSYFILNYYGGASSVGIYSVGVMISEALWMVAGSIAIVQYSKISNTGDGEYSRNLTVKLAKFSFLVTFFLLVVLMLIPASVLTLIFGKEFGGIHNIIIWLAIGILSFGFSVILSHYFAGTGKYHVNTIAAFLGLIITLAGNFLLVPKIGYEGAAITASAAYLAISIFQLAVFLKVSNTPLSSFKPNKEDANLFFEKLAKLKK